MKTIKIKTLGVLIDYQVPETVEEYDRLAGREGACLEAGILNTVYRSSLPQIRSISLHGREQDENGPEVKGIDEQTGIKRKETVVRKDKDGEPVMGWDETEGAYSKRVCAEKSVEPDEFQPHIQEVANLVPFDPSSREPAVSGPKTPTKTAMRLAKSMVESGKAEEKAAWLSSEIGREVTAEVESLARAIDTRERQRKAAALKELMGDV